MNRIKTSKKNVNPHGVYKKQSSMPVSVSKLFDWHSRYGAIERLSPPWDPIRVVHRTGGIQKGDRVSIRMKAGPIPYIWQARHIEFKQGQVFIDEQIRGPFKKWTHVHKFFKKTDQNSRLEDRIEYQLPIHPLGNIFLSQLVQKKLDPIFRFRHRVTKRDLSRHQAYANKKRQKILITGGRGFIGSNLIPFLTTGGHEVINLTRSSNLRSHECYWDPDHGVMNLGTMEGLDSVIHLAGDNIGNGRWTPEKKRKIIDSRIKSTQLLLDYISKLKTKPKTFISASAIGYYGDRQNQCLDENDACGSDFISEVCEQWECAAQDAIPAEIRSVFLRIGVVLSPVDGALARLLPFFKLGLGAKLGKGSQYLSWIDIEDVIGAIYFSLFEKTLSGPVNLTAPNSVTNLEFSKQLGQVLRRPVKLTLPGKWIRLIFGQMGEEILLSSTRVTPEKLLTAGYEFCYPDLKKALTHMLGKG